MITSDDMDKFADTALAIPFEDELLALLNARTDVAILAHAYALQGLIEKRERTKKR